MKQIPLITAWVTGNELPPKRTPEEVKRLIGAILAGDPKPPPKPPAMPQQDNQERLDL